MDNKKLSVCRLADTIYNISAYMLTFSKGKEMKTFKQVIKDTNLHPGHSIKHHYPGKDIPKGWHLMPDGSIMKDSDHPKEENDVTLKELSPTLKRARRLKRMNDNLRKTMAKYGAATKAGIDPSKVHQRRTQLTVKK